MKQMQKATLRLVMSVRPSAWSNSAPTGRAFVTFIFVPITKNPCTKLMLVKTGRIIITDFSHEELRTFQYLAVIGYHR